MLAEKMLNQVRALFANLKNDYTLLLTLPANHAKGNEMKALLSDVASCSDKVSFETIPGDNLLFKILKNKNTDSNIIFKMIPNGHEFTTLLLAILNADGIGKNLPDEQTIKRIQSIQGPVHLKSYISLTCTNCPDVVQALNIMAIYNKGITHELIDGGLYKEEIDEKNIQAVPSVYIGDEVLHIGRSNLGELIDKIEEKAGSSFEVEEQEERHFDVIIVGGGPAGVSSAVYASRKGFSVALVAEVIGGQVTETMDIENLISTKKTTGAQLTVDMINHIDDYSIDVFENRRVESIITLEGKKIIKTNRGDVFSTQALILATGASWKKLGVPGEREYIGSGVAFCTHCDGPFYKDKKVVVIGGGNSGLEAAIDLSAIASEVHVFEFMDELKGDQILQDKLANLGHVHVHTGIATQEVLGNGSKVTGIKYKDRKTETEQELETDGVFVQIGLKPNSDLFQGLVPLSKYGEVEVDAACRTTVPGIYGAGDVTVVPYKQIVVAMGEGSKAALSAFEDQIKGALV